MKFLKKNLLYFIYSLILVSFMILLALYMTAAVKNKKTHNELVHKYNQLASYTDAEIKKRDEAVEHLVQTIKDNDKTIVKLQKEINDYSDKNSEQNKQIEDLTNEKNELLEEIEQLKISKANKAEEPATTEAPYIIESVTQDGMTYLGSYELTAYMETGNPCADGVYPSTGYTAACTDPSLWHRWVYIEGLGQFYIHDTGGMPSYNIIDIYMGTYDACINFGRQSANVYLVN